MTFHCQVRYLASNCPLNILSDSIDTFAASSLSYFCQWCQQILCLSFCFLHLSQFLYRFEILCTVLENAISSASGSTCFCRAISRILVYAFFDRIWSLWNNFSYRLLSVFDPGFCGTKDYDDIKMVIPNLLRICYGQIIRIIANLNKHYYP